MAREPKTAEDIDKAINFFTEAICSSSSSFQQNDKGAAKIHAARGNPKFSEFSKILFSFPKPLLHYPYK